MQLEVLFELEGRPAIETKLLLVLTVALSLVSVLLPYAPFVSALGFVPLPWKVLCSVLAITALYVLAAEWMKRALYAGRSTEARARQALE